jgi:hypothetical protein
MLGLFLGLITYDTVTTVSKNIKRKEDKAARKKKFKDLQWRLSRPMTRNHYLDCKCRLCVRRREDCTLEFNMLLSGVK